MCTRQRIQFTKECSQIVYRTYPCSVFTQIATSEFHTVPVLHHPHEFNLLHNVLPLLQHIAVTHNHHHHHHHHHSPSAAAIHILVFSRLNQTIFLNNSEICSTLHMSHNLCCCRHDEPIRQTLYGEVDAVNKREIPIGLK